MMELSRSAGEDPRGEEFAGEPSSSPEGTAELSPGRQSWVDHSNEISPGGTAEHTRRGFSRP